MPSSSTGGILWGNDVDIHALFGPQLAPADVVRIAGALDGLGEPERLDAIAHLRRKELAALYEAAAGNPPLHLTDFVPTTVPARTEVIHEGKNSLPLFTRFQKRFCRAANPEELWGYNEQANRLFTGPGYFVAHHNERGELVIDYRSVPPARPEDLPPGWPPIIPNSARLSRFIYNGTVDVMRRVSQRVSIGRAERAGKPMDAWFALVRCTPPEV
jgi:hypothetical protein